MSHHSGEPPPATAASAISGKTARACDSCVLRRARWYCAADEAFLCHPCDASVHSANPLARRHERLRLKSSSSAVPSWHHGFKRKARTPRPHHKPVVPELESSGEEEEEQLLYRVPVMDPALAFSNSSPPLAAEPPRQAAVVVRVGAEFAPTELELAEFAADMESLLGRELDGGESFCMEELGLLDERVAEVKAEVEEEGDLKGGGLSFELEVDLSKETIDLDFGCGSPETAEEEEAAAEVKGEGREEEMKRGMGLRLNYEAVKEAWLVRGSSPWISGGRPRLGAEEFWLQCMGMRGGEIAGGGIQVMNVGREARVTRYREKRRTRLFSKKIRYEVRKLNAEKRPRMKGRFVKRASFTPVPAAAIRGGSSSGGGLVAAAC